MELRLARTGPNPDGVAVILAAVPVVKGRLSLGRRVGKPSVPMAALAGLRSVCWLGPDPESAPGLGRLVHQTTVAVDERGRVVLNRRLRGFLGLVDPDDFEAVVVVLPSGGVLVVPADDFDGSLGRVVLP
jgi:hypothetical protein